MKIEASFDLERDKGGKVIGFSLVSGAETYSQVFIENFANALRQKKASIRIEDNNVIFEKDGSEPLIFKRAENEIEDLKRLFANKGLRRIMKPTIALTSGFRIFFQAKI